MNRLNYRKGISIIEVIIGSAIIVIALVALVSSMAGVLKVDASSSRSVQATLLADEGIEVMRHLRDISWDSSIAPLTTGSTYHFEFNGSSWSVVAGAGSLIDSALTRTVIVNEVQRDAESDIVSSGGTVDPGTKLVTVTVTYPTSSGISTTTASTYLMNIFSN